MKKDAMKAVTPNEAIGEQRKALVEEQIAKINERLIANYSDELPFFIEDRNCYHSASVSPYLVCDETLKAFTESGWDIYRYEVKYHKVVQVKRSDMKVGAIYDRDPNIKDTP